MLATINIQQPSMTVLSDASRGWGCGAYCRGKWFQLQWVNWLVNAHTTEWRERTVLAWVDNLAVIQIINNGSTRDRESMHLVCRLVFIQARFQIYITAQYIQGMHNTIADALSRNNMSLFFHCTCRHLQCQLQSQWNYSTYSLYPN